MQISKDLTDKIFDTVVDDEHMTEAVNAIVNAYNEFMASAWENMDKEPGVLAQRGFSYAVAMGAMFQYLTHGATPNIEEMIAEGVEEVYQQMREQIAEWKAQKKKDKEAPSA